jgi:ABC-type glycerol-3-phosphate transport system substrate-binding protein
MEAYTVDGNVYCLPYDLSSQLILCNLDIFEEMGVEFKPEGCRMDEFVEIGKKLTNENHFVSDIYPNSWTLNAFLLHAGVPVLGPDGNINLDTPEMAWFFQWLVDSVRGVHTQEPASRGSLGAVEYCNVYEMWYVSPHTITFLSERRYPAFQSGESHLGLKHKTQIPFDRAGGTSESHS